MRADHIIEILRGDVSPFLGVARLRRREAQIVDLLVCTGRVTREAIADALFPKKDFQHAVQNINAHMTPIRRKLESHEITVKTLYGIGWEISDADRAKLRELAGVAHV